MQKRCVRLGNHVSLYFEDAMTLRYQIQEMLRVEKIFEEEGIIAELDVYNALMPDGTNFKATMMIEYTNEVERRAALARFIGIEDRIYIQVNEHMQVGCDHPAYPALVEKLPSDTLGALLQDLQ